MAATETKRRPGRPTKAESEARRVAAAASEAVSGNASDKTLGVQNRYDAAGRGRRIAGWNPPQTGPNRALVGLNIIRSRARDAVRNDWAGESATTKWTTTLIGIGIKARFDSITSTTRRKKVTDAFSDWCEVADADGVLNFFGLQTLVVRAWLESGECFARLRDRPLTSALGVPFQVQLLEADFCPYNLDIDAWPGMAPGNRIRQGIELTPDGQRAAYWMFPEHPGDWIIGIPPTVASLIRVPADQVLHVFEPKRPGQLRGVSALASVLIRLRNTTDFEDVTLDRQKLANLFTMFITRALPPDSADIDFDPDTGLPKWYDDNDNAVATLEAGMTQELQPGEDVKFANPPEAGTMFSDYMRTTHMGTFAGAGLPYELGSGDIRNVSDRTLRVVMQEFRRFAAARQWQVVIPMFCQKVVVKWAQSAVLAGIVRPNEYDSVRRPTWAPHGFEHIHPVQDPQGKILEIQAGIRSRSSVIGESGDDPIDVDNERAADQTREKALGLPDTSGAVTPVAPKPGSIVGDHGGPGDNVQPGTDAWVDRLIAGLTLVPKEPPVPSIVNNYVSHTRAIKKNVVRDEVTGLVTSIEESEIEE